MDKDAFKGDSPEIAKLVPYSPFDFYLKRKLYIHNMGHATCAYLGDILGLSYIYESIDRADVYILVKNAMLESAQALSAQYDAPVKPLMDHIDDLLGRFTNAALGDTCQRVGGDPVRKLSPEDRLIGAGKLALQQGIMPCHIAVGAAAGVRRYLAENDKPQSMENAAEVLAQVSGLMTEEPLAQMILDMYRLILEGASIYDLRKIAGQKQAQNLQNAI